MLSELRKARAVVRSASTRVRRAASYFLPYRPMKGGESHLDGQYAKGSWEYLRGVGELPRFSLVVGYCQHFRPNGRIAEVGAGDGILHERLDRTKYLHYLGLDISKVAIDRLSDRADAANEFVAADAATFVPAERYDVVIFNEVLEYFEGPHDVVRHWSRHLAPDGIIIVSMFSGLDTARSVKIWHALKDDFETLAEAEVKNERSMRWKVKVLAPRSPKA